MFKGCNSLKSLNLSNFDTSKVTDMNSMFEGCYSLVSLDLNDFNTQNVLYMNRMFYNCLNLKSLYFHNISSDSLGTMQHMFYNCSNLEYLDIYSLTEKAQSIVKMFQGASTTFTFCIEENENIPNIFKELLEMPETKRDCDSSCYYNSRRAIPEKKLCCKFVEYNGNCYDKCPSRTKVYDWSNKQCQDFQCSKYYNYEQDDCIDNLPEQHYVNDTRLKTIDKCHPDCKTCSSKAIDSNHTNCETCANSQYI
jgi:surface protein